MDFLISGCMSGLGKFLHEKIGGYGLSRYSTNTPIESDYIIHTAYNTKNILQNDMCAYLDDTIELTKKLLNIKHKKFIFISSIDVYPKNDETYCELDNLDLSYPRNLYSCSKIMCESIIMKYSSNFLILRPSSLLGIYMKKNSFLNIAESSSPQLSLTFDSSFNYVTYKDILQFIELGIENGITGIFNTTSNDNIYIKDVVSYFNKDSVTKYGNYQYKVGNINNSKINNICDILNKSSLDSIKEFINEKN